MPPPSTGLQLWLEADAGTFQTSGGAAATADGDPVGEWQDQSGNGRHFGQTTAGLRPTLRLNVRNGLPSIRPDGFDDYLTTASTLTGAHVFAVIFPGTTLPDFAGLFTESIDAAAPDTWLNFFTRRNIPSVWYFQLTDSYVSATTVAHDQIVENKVIVGEWQLQEGWSTTPQACKNGMIILRDRNNANRYWVGDIALLLVYDTQQTGTPLNDIYSYIKTKYEIPETRKTHLPGIMFALG